MIMIGHCCHCTSPVGAVNLRAFNKSTGNIVWEDAAVTLGNLFKPHSEGQNGNSSIDNKILAMSWIPDYDEVYPILGTGGHWGEITSGRVSPVTRTHPYPRTQGRIYFDREQQYVDDLSSSGAMRNWILRYRLIDIDTGESSWLPGNIGVSAFSDTTTDLWDADPNGHAEKLGDLGFMPSNTMGQADGQKSRISRGNSGYYDGYNQGGPWRIQQSSNSSLGSGWMCPVWDYGKVNPRGVTRRFHIDPNPTSLELEFSLLILAYRDFPDITVTFKNTDSLETITEKFILAPQVESVDLSTSDVHEGDDLFWGYNTNRLQIDCNLFERTQNVGSLTQRRLGVISSATTYISHYESAGHIKSSVDLTAAGIETSSIHNTGAWPQPVMQGNGHFNTITEVSGGINDGFPIITEYDGETLEPTGNSFTLGMYTQNPGHDEDFNPAAFKDIRLRRGEDQRSLRFSVGSVPASDGYSQPFNGSLHLRMEDYALIELDLPFWWTGGYSREYPIQAKYRTTTLETSGHLKTMAAAVYSEGKIFHDPGTTRAQIRDKYEIPVGGAFQHYQVGNPAIGGFDKLSAGVNFDVCDATHTYAIESSTPPHHSQTSPGKYQQSHTIYRDNWGKFGSEKRFSHSHVDYSITERAERRKLNLNENSKWRLWVAGQGSLYDTWPDQEFTEWMAHDISMVDFQAVLDSTFGKHFTQPQSPPSVYPWQENAELRSNLSGSWRASGVTNPISGFTESWSHDVMPWQTSLRLSAKYADSTRLQQWLGWVDSLAAMGVFPPGEKWVPSHATEDGITGPYSTHQEWEGAVKKISYPLGYIKVEVENTSFAYEPLGNLTSIDLFTSEIRWSTPFGMTAAYKRSPEYPHYPEPPEIPPTEAIGPVIMSNTTESAVATVVGKSKNGYMSRKLAHSPL